MDYVCSHSFSFNITNACLISPILFFVFYIVHMYIYKLEKDVEITLFK
jgi:hypothetical protein